MTTEQRRRSARIMELDARRSQPAECQNKGKGTCGVALENLDTDEDNFNLKRGRKRVKIRPVQLLVCNRVGYQVEKVGNSSNGDRLTNAAMSSETALPEKGKLETLLGILRRKDVHKIFAEPVNPQEVKGYYDIIKEPMDFSTISMKLNGGIYKTLEEFQHDITLISSNAMLFNHSSTIYYRQARIIRNLSMKLLDGLKADPENFGSELFMKRLQAAYRDERRSKYAGQDRRATYKPFDSFLNDNESIVSTVYKRSGTLVQDDTEIGYEQSLMEFVKDLGPTAQMVARRKLKRCSAEAFGDQNGTPHHELQTQKYQILNVSSGQESTIVPSSSNVLRQYSRKNFRNKMNNNPGKTWPEKVPANGTTIVNDVPRSRFAEANNTMKNAAEYTGKSIQTLGGGCISLEQDMVCQGIGNSYPSTSPSQDGNPNLSSIRSISSRHDEYISSTINNRKNVQMADATPYNVRNPAGPNRRSFQTIKEEATAFNEYAADQGIECAYLSTALLGDGKAHLSATSNRDGNHEKFIPDAIKKTKNVQVGEVNSSNLVEHHGAYRGKSVQGMSQACAVFSSVMADQGNLNADFSTDLLGAFSTTNSIPSELDKLISSSNGKGKHGQLAEVMDLGEGAATFNEDTADQDIGISNFSTFLLRDENSNFPDTWQTLSKTNELIARATNKGKNLQMSEMTLSEPRMKESLFPRDFSAFSSKELQPLPEAMSPSWNQGQSTIGLDSNYLVGGVNQSEAMADGGGTSYRGVLEQAGQAGNWFSPTQVGPQSMLYSAFQEQSRASKVGVPGEAGSPQWGGWGSTSPNEQQVMEASDMNESHLKGNQVDWSIGTPLGNNHHQKYLIGSNYQQQSPVANNCLQKSPLTNNHHQQSALANDCQQQSPMSNKYQQQSPVANNCLQKSPLTNNHHQQSALAINCQQQSPMSNNYQQQSPMANKYLLKSPLASNKQQQSPLANNHQRQSPLRNNYQQQSSLVNTYLQQSPLGNNYAQQSPTPNNYQQQQPLLASYYRQQQSPLANNYCWQQSPLANNDCKQRFLLSNNYHQQQSPLANTSHQQKQFPLANDNCQPHQSPLANNNLQQQFLLSNNYGQNIRQQQQSPLANNNCQKQSLWSNNYRKQQSSLTSNNHQQQQFPLTNNTCQQPSLLSNTYHLQPPSGNNSLLQAPLGNSSLLQSPLRTNHHQQNNQEQQSSLAKNYLEQRSPLAHHFRQRQSPLGNKHHQQSSLANNNVQQQSPLINNSRQQQTLLGNNCPVANSHRQ